MITPADAPTHATGLPQARRVSVGFVVLAIIWAIAFNVDALPFFTTVTIGGIVTGAVGLWVRAASDEPDPTFAVTPAQAGLAVAVAAAHFVVGHALFRLGALLLPELTATAAAVYDRADGVPLWAAVLLGGVMTASLEEIFWRGAFTPMVARRVQARVVARYPSTRRSARFLRMSARIGVSTVGYTLFHVATLKLALVAAAALGGLVWGWLLDRTHSVGATIIAHALWTIAMLVLPPSL